MSDRLIIRRSQVRILAGPPINSYLSKIQPVNASLIRISLQLGKKGFDERGRPKKCAYQASDGAYHVNLLSHFACGRQRPMLLKSQAERLLAKDGLLNARGSFGIAPAQPCRPHHRGAKLPAHRGYCPRRCAGR